MKRYFRDYSILLIVTGMIIALDQWTKGIVRTNIPEGSFWMPWEWLKPYARIVNWHNTGAAFGMMQDWGWLFTGLAFVVSGLILYYYPRIDPSDWTLRLAMWLQLGGAVGNLIDRLTIGRVTDFISIGTFPVYNVADSCITVSVVVLLFGVWMKERSAKKPIKSKEGFSIGKEAGLTPDGKDTKGE